MSLFKRIAEHIEENESYGLFTRRIPSFSEFVESPEYLGQSPLFKAQHSAFVAPFGDDPTLYFSKSKQFSKIALCYGKGSGKAFYAAYSLSYLIYVLGSHVNIYRHLGIPDASPLDVLVVASSQNQSSGIVYQRLCRCLESPIFKSLGAKVGKEVTTLEPSITVRAMSSNPATMEGFSPILSLMDEASGFRDASGNSSAEEVYKVLTTSAHSRFLGSSTVFVTSYPRRHNDFILRLVKRAAVDSSIWADVKASWEVRDDREESDYAREFAADFDTASTFYGCKPPVGFGSWFRNRLLLEACFGDVEESVTVREEITYNGEQAMISLSITEARAIEGRRYFAHGDPGIKNDAFALAIGSMTEDGSVEICAILRWKPDRKHGIIVDLANVEATIIALNETFHFEQVTFDKFQSASIIQNLLNSGISSSDMAFSNPEQLNIYRNLRSLVDSQRIKIIDSPIALREMSELERLESGRPDHPFGGSKDVADCIAAVSHAITQASGGTGGSVDEGLF